MPENYDHSGRAAWDPASENKEFNTEVASTKQGEKI